MKLSKYFLVIILYAIVISYGLYWKYCNPNDFGGIGLSLTAFAAFVAFIVTQKIERIRSAPNEKQDSLKKGKSQKKTSNSKSVEIRTDSRTVFDNVHMDIPKRKILFKNKWILIPIAMLTFGIIMNFWEKHKKANIPITLDERYYTVHEESDGLIAVEDSNFLTGYVDRNGIEVITPKYSSVKDFKNGYAIVYKGNYPNWLAGVIDRDENTIVPFEYNDIRVSEFDCYQFETKEGENGLFNSDWKVIVKGKYTTIKPYKYGLFILGKKEFDNWEYGICNVEGKELLSVEYDNISSKDFYRGQPNETLFVEKDRKYGVFDPKTKKYTGLVFDLIKSFQNGYAVVLANHNYGLIDSIGNEILPCIYDKIEIQSGSALIKKGGFWGVFDIHNRESIDCKYDEVTPFKFGLVLVKENGRYNFIDSNGMTVNEVSFDKALPFLDKEYSLVELNNIQYKFYAIDGRIERL